MFTSTYISSNGSGGYNSWTNPQKDVNTNAVAFETSNGESVAVFYNPLCQADMGESGWHYTQPKMCTDFIYDLNGRKGPNKVGKDIGFITALYPVEPNIVAPMSLGRDAKNGSSATMAQTAAAAACRAQDENSRVPNRDELAAMFYNNQLIGITPGDFWSGSVVSSDTAWRQDFLTGSQHVISRSGLRYVRCIKR